MPQRLVVLIVDDEEICLTIVSEMVKKFGLPTLTARDGLEAVEIFQQHRHEIGCILMDLQMPRMDGIECCRQIRKLDGKVQVVIVSGYLNDTYYELLLPLNPAGYLKKPVSFSDLSKLLLRVTPRLAL
jgi:CheY-like chemotaxis protein